MVDVRWRQRLSSFESALQQLTAAVQLAKQRPLSDLETQGLIQAFEFTHELAWNVLRDYLVYQGAPGISGSRDATREAFSRGLIAKGEPWMEMIQSRNNTSHTYNKAIAQEISDKILKAYFPLFVDLSTKMKSLK